MQTNFESLKAESDRKKRERQSMSSAKDGYVLAILKGERVAVDPKILAVNGVALGKMQEQLVMVEATIEAMQKTITILAQKNSELQNALNTANDSIAGLKKRAADSRTLIDNTIRKFTETTEALKNSDQAQAESLNQIISTLKGVKL